MVKSNQPLLNQDMDKLNRKKRVAGSLLVYELRQRHRMLRVTMQGVCNQPYQVITGQRLQMDLPDRSPALPDRRQPAHQGVRRVDFIVSISPDDQQIRQILLDQQIFQKVEGRCIEPLQVVEEQHQRVFRARENANELPERKLRA